MNLFLQTSRACRVGGLVLLSAWLLSTVAWGQTFVPKTGTDNPFNGVDVGVLSAPVGDLDGDADLDAVVGERFGTLRYLKNAGTATALGFPNQRERGRRAGADAGVVQRLNRFGNNACPECSGATRRYSTGTYRASPLACTCCA